MTVDEIFESWNNEFHGQVSYYIQTIYKIRNKLFEENCVKYQKSR